MKYCTKCGAEILDDATFCVKCGSAIDDTQTTSTNAAENAKPQKKDDTLKTVAKVFMLISCISTGTMLLPLLWTVPMTMKYWNDVKYGRPTGTGFKICTILFVNTIAGILMLCDD